MKVNDPACSADLASLLLFGVIGLQLHFIPVLHMRWCSLELAPDDIASSNTSRTYRLCGTYC